MTSYRYKVIVEEAARLDILSIIQYVIDNFQEPVVAGKIQANIAKEIITLRDFPKRNKLLNDEPYRTKGYRVIYVKNYAIFYKVIENIGEVHVMRILYNRRDWKNLI